MNLRYLIIMTIAGVSLLAQTFPAPHLTQWWDGGNVIRILDTYPQKLQRIDVQGKSLNSLASLAGVRNHWYLDGRAFAYVREKQKGLLYESVNFGPWHLTNQIDGNQSIEAPHQLFPIGNGRFLGWNPGGFTASEKASYFAIFSSKANDNIEFSNLLDMGLKEPLLVKAATGNGRSFQKNPKMARMSTSLGISGDFQVFPGDDGVVLAHFWTGRFIFINPKGSIKRIVQLYNLTEAELGSFDTEVAIVDAQPTVDGQILICARTEEAVKQNPKLFQTKGTVEQMKAPGGWDALQQRRSDALKADPRLMWFLLDTSEGTLKETLPPPGAPNSIWDLRIFMKFRFVLLGNGHIFNPS